MPKVRNRNEGYGDTFEQDYYPQEERIGRGKSSDARRNDEKKRKRQSARRAKNKRREEAWS